MEFVYILFGWFIGLFSPFIINFLSEFRKEKLLKKIILNELIIIKNKLVGLTLIVYPRYGILDEDRFNWIKDESNNFNFIEDDFLEKELFNIISNKEQLLSFLSKYNSHLIENNPGFFFKKFSTYIIDSNLINLLIIKNGFTEKVLEIKFYLDALNEEITSVLDYSKMTFDSNISSDNHKIILDEIKKKNLLIAERSVFIVNKIRELSNFR